MKCERLFSKELLFSLLKGTFILSLSDMKRVIKDAVYRYNNLIPHYSCDYKTPEYMHHQKQIKIKSYEKKAVLKGMPFRTVIVINVLFLSNNCNGYLGLVPIKSYHYSLLSAKPFFRQQKLGLISRYGIQPFSLLLF